MVREFNGNAEVQSKLELLVELPHGARTVIPELLQHLQLGVADARPVVSTLGHGVGTSSGLSYRLSETSDILSENLTKTLLPS